MSSNVRNGDENRGNIEIVQRPVRWNAQPKIGSLELANHQPQGGNVPIFNDKPQWNKQSKVGSLDNAHYRHGGGTKIISTSPRPDYNRTITPKIGSLSNTHYRPGHLSGPQKLNWGKDEVMWTNYEQGRTSRTMSRALSRNSVQTVP